MIDQLDSCPFCDGADLVIHDLAAPANDTPSWSVCCCSCGADGPRCETAQLAVENWSKRPMTDDQFIDLMDQVFDVEAAQNPEAA